MSLCVCLVLDTSDTDTEVAKTDKYPCPYRANGPGTKRDIGSHEMRIMIEERNWEW